MSHRDLEEVLATCGVKIDHETLNRRVPKYARQEFGVTAAAVHRNDRAPGPALPRELTG